MQGYRRAAGHGGGVADIKHWRDCVVLYGKMAAKFTLVAYAIERKLDARASGDSTLVAPHPITVFHFPFARTSSIIETYF